MTKEDIIKAGELAEKRYAKIHKLITICGNNNIDFDGLIDSVSQMVVKREIQQDDLIQLMNVIKGL